MSEGSSGELLAKVDVLIRLVALGICGEKTQREKIALLNSVGLGPTAIAEILGTTSNTVNVALSAMRKQAKKTKTAQKSKGE